MAFIVPSLEFSHQLLAFKSLGQLVVIASSSIDPFQHLLITPSSITSSYPLKVVNYYFDHLNQSPFYLRMSIKN